MKRIIDYMKELSDEKIEEIIQSRYNVQIDINNYDEESIYIKEALQNMIKLDISDNHEGMIISYNWVMPSIDDDNEKIIYESNFETFYVNFNLLKEYPKEKWYEQRFSIEGLDWNKALGSYLYCENELSDCIESIFHGMVMYGNNVEEWKVNFDEYCKRSEKKIQDIKDGKSKTYTLEEFYEMLDEDFGENLERKRHEIVFKKMKNEYYQAAEQCIIQNNNHLVEIIEQYYNDIKNED